MFLPLHTRIYLAAGSTDMRKAINGLSILVEDQMELDPFSGKRYVNPTYRFAGLIVMGSTMFGRRAL